MPMDPKKRLEYAAKISAAYAACTSGAEDGEDKMNEAFEAYEADGGSDTCPPGEMPTTDHGGHTNGGGTAAPGTDAGEMYDAGPDLSFEDHPAEAFAALQRQNKQLADRVTKLSTVAQAAVGKAAKLEFSAYCDGLKRDGYQLPAPEVIDEQFSACLEAKEPPKAVERLRKLLKTYPRTDLSEQPAMFGANAAGALGSTKKNPARKTDAEVFDIAADMGLQDFSSDDAKWAAVAEAVSE